MKPVRLGTLLKQVTKSKGIGQRLRRAMAVDLWPRVVGETISSQTVAGPVRDRVLLVRTDNPVLAHQINQMREEILRRYQKMLGTGSLRGIHLKIGEVPAAVPEDKPQEIARRKELSTEEIEELNGMTSTIPQSDLAEAFARAYQSWALSKEITPESEKNYFVLATGESWPSSTDMEKALAKVDPSSRERVQKKAADELKKKIVHAIQAEKRSMDDLTLRGELRRLAIILGHPLAGSYNKILTEILGCEAAATRDKN